MKRRPEPRIAVLALTLGLIVSGGSMVAWGYESMAHDGCCQECGAECTRCPLKTCTIMVPMNITETRVRTRVEKVTEDREEKYTVFQHVPVTRKITKERCYLDDEVRTKMITEKECHRVTVPVIRTCVVKVPETVQQEIMVQREICTPEGKVCVEEPCIREITVERDDYVSKTCQEPQVVIETKQREISYCVKTPKKEVIPCCEETRYELQPVEKTRTVQVCVPKIVKEPYCVTVCKLMPKTVQCCPDCASRCQSR
jgi:hypothetical protein